MVYVCRRLHHWWRDLYINRFPQTNMASTEPNELAVIRSGVLSPKLSRVRSGSRDSVFIVSLPGVAVWPWCCLWTRRDSVFLFFCQRTRPTASTRHSCLITALLAMRRFCSFADTYGLFLDCGGMRTGFQKRRFCRVGARKRDTTYRRRSSFRDTG